MKSFSCLVLFGSNSEKEKRKKEPVRPRGQEEINSTGGIRGRGGEVSFGDSSALLPERVALVVVLQLVLLVVSQLSVSELPVHGAVLAHVDDVLVIVVVVVIIVVVLFPPQSTLSEVDQAALLEAATGGAGVAAVRCRGSRAVAAAAAAISAPGAQLLVSAWRDVRGRTLGTGVSDEEHDSHQPQHQQDAGDDEDCQVASDLLFLLIPEG